MPTIGKRIQAARHAQGWTQVQLAGVMGYSTVYISCIERDVYKPSGRAISAFEKALRTKLVR